MQRYKDKTNDSNLKTITVQAIVFEKKKKFLLKLSNFASQFNLPKKLSPKMSDFSHLFNIIYQFVEAILCK